MEQIICQIGKSTEKEQADKTAYNKSITDYLKINIQLYIRSKVEAEIEGGI